MKTAPDSHDLGVALPQGETGSGFLHRLLTEATERFPDELSSARLPRSAGAFKSDYANPLTRFEAARAGSPKRVEIARFLAGRMHEALRFRSSSGEVSLSEHLAAETAAPKLTTRGPDEGEGKPGLRVEVPFEGRVHRGSEARALVDRLFHEHHLSEAARRALQWSIAHIEDTHGGSLDLRGERFALLGAGAELAPTPFLLAAGATVLWIDVTPPERASKHHAEALSHGTVVTAEGASDLLAHPHAIAAAVRRFAEEGPVHLGLFAYAPGSGRELRLAAAMDAIARALGPSVLRSVAMYISPTSPAEAQPEDLDVARSREARRPPWQALLERTPALTGPGHFTHGDASVARAVVTLQGPTYQAAQYLAKVCSAEVLAVDGLAEKKVTVSANVAGITDTRSLAHPLFQAAFVGAPSFGVRIFEPDTTRALATLLLLHDLRNPQAPGSATRGDVPPATRAKELRAQQLHGGVFNMPWIFEHAVRNAAVIGLAKKPSLLFSRTKGER